MVSGSDIKAYSANAPGQRPITRSPGLNPVTLGPQLTTSPAASIPICLAAPAL